MTTGQIVALAIYLALTILPLIFRQSRPLRFICVLLLLGASLNMLCSGVRLAMRNVDSPSREQMKEQVEYIGAWQDGATAVQAKVDTYLFPLGALCSSIALIALVPMKNKEKRFQQGHGA